MIDIEKVIDALDSEQVCYEEGIEMKKKGNRISILCPNHNDKQFGSCFLTPKGYHCFVCNETHSLIDLIMGYGNYSYKEAIFRLAEIAGGVELFSDGLKDSTSKKPFILNNEELAILGLRKKVYSKNYLNVLEKNDDFKSSIHFTYDDSGFSIKENIYYEPDIVSIDSLYEENPDLVKDMLIQRAEYEYEKTFSIQSIYQNIYKFSNNSEAYEIYQALFRRLNTLVDILKKLGIKKEERKYQKSYF